MLAHSPELIDGDRHREILTSLFRTLSFGELAVNGFFLLSGYLIVQSWQRTPRLFNFLKKRILRIYPGFMAATLVCAFLVGPLGAPLADYFAHLNLFQLLKGMLLLHRPSIPPVFAGQPFPDVNGSMWTIAYEFRCYLLVALFGMVGIVNRRKVWLIFSVFVTIISVFPDVAAKIHFPGSNFLLGDSLTFIHLFSFFCAGGCFYLFRQQIRYSRVWAISALPIAVLSLFSPTALQLILPTLGAYAFFWFAFLKLPSLQRFQSSADVSYGVYLYGWPIQKLLFWYFPLLSPWLAFVLACGLSFACGLLSWHLVEKPCMRLKNLRGRGTRPQPSTSEPPQATFDKPS